MYPIHRHTGGLEIPLFLLTIATKIHRHTGGLESMIIILT